MRTQQAPSATPHGGLLFGPLAKYNALTGYEPNSWVEVSSEHTPIHYPFNEHAFFSKSDHSATVAASEKHDGFQQQAAEQASGNRCDDSQSVAHSLLSADMCGASGNRCVVMSQLWVWKECCPEEKVIEL